MRVLVTDLISVALQGLRTNKLRSALTMLGLIIGVTSVILLTSFGQGVAGSVTATVAQVANQITIVPKDSPVPGGPPSHPLTDADQQQIATIPQIAQMVPQVTGATTGAAGQTSLAVTVSTPGSHFTSATVTGTTSNYVSATQKHLQAGTFFNEEQASSGAHVAVLGPSIAKALFGEDPQEALNKTIRIQHRYFLVIGVLESFGANNDNVVIVPEAASRSGILGYGYGGDELSSMVALATSTADVASAEQQITDILRENHHITNPQYDDFQIQDLGARVTTFTNLISLIADFVPAVAAISLLVGGIGVLNIMLVSVTDRTREIGTRKAVGASDSAILAQFVVEATTISTLGGLIGIAIGVGLILIVKAIIPFLGASGLLSSFNPTISIASIIVPFLISVVIGLVAGGYPAWRAAQLEPIEALRYE